MLSQDQQLEGLWGVAVAKLSACEQGAARICGDFVALKGHVVRQKAHKDALDELLSESESTMATTSQAKLELEIENRMLRSELDALRQFIGTGRRERKISGDHPQLGTGVRENDCRVCKSEGHQQPIDKKA